MRIEGHCFVVTGGASGLGAACARYLVEQGGRVVLLDLQEEAGRATVEELGGPSHAMFVVTDITEEDSVKEALTKAVDTFGDIHGVVNCAGIAAAMKVLSRNGPHPLRTFERVLKINVTGTFNVLRLVAERMSKQEPVNEDGERGVIINIASVAAFDGQVGQAAYSASKGAIVAMSLPLARELGPTLGIRVNAVAPGVMGTPMLKSLPQKAQDSLIKQVCFPKRLGFPEEFGRICGDIIENSYINGECIRLDASIRMAAM